MKIQENLKAIKLRIKLATKRVGRNPKDIQLVVAGKYADVDTTLQSITAGVKIIGENREQDLRQKFKVIGNQVDWHFIGHLQRNKVKSVIKIVSMIHSVNSLRLANELEKRLAKIDKKLPVLIEVNTSGEKTKHGLPPNKVPNLAKLISNFKHLNLVGLMTMGALASHPEENRKNFKTLANLLKQINQLKLPNISLTQLSIGTTQDFEIAIEEGATLVRVGSAIFK